MGDHDSSVPDLQAVHPIIGEIFQPGPKTVKNLLCKIFFFFLSTASFISRVKLFLLKVFHWCILNAPSFHWQCHVNPGSWLCLPCVGSSVTARLLSGATGQTDSCLERDSHGSKQNLSLRVSVTVKPHPVCDFPNVAWYVHCHRLQATPTVTPTPTTACHSRGYYKFDNISNHCRKSANTNTS